MNSKLIAAVAVVIVLVAAVGVYFVTQQDESPAMLRTRDRTRI